MKLAFVDHSFHKKSKSGDFLRELLAPYFEITNYWDDSWDGGKRVPVEEINKHDYVFYFQNLNSFSEIKKIKAKIIWCPMWDGTPTDALYWKSIASFPIKVLAFSNKITEFCNQYNIQVIKLKYYKNPKDFNYKLPTGRHLFFWYRGSIKWEEIKPILPSELDSFTYLSIPDPHYKEEVISEEDIEKYKINIIRKDFLSHEDFIELLSKSNIFITPRKKEGIGMAMLEALAMGQCVVSYDGNTMNEYINEKNGYLFKPNLDFSNLDSIIEKSKLTCEEGFREWVKQKESIIRFMKENNEDIPFSIYPKLYTLRQMYRVTKAIPSIIKHKIR